MKKQILFFVVAILFLVFASCKSHEKCPAYGKANVSQTGKAS